MCICGCVFLSPKDALEVCLENGVLTIRGKRTEREEEEQQEHKPSTEADKVTVEDKGGKEQATTQQQQSGNTPQQQPCGQTGISTGHQTQTQPQESKESVTGTGTGAGAAGSTSATGEKKDRTGQEQAGEKKHKRVYLIREIPGGKVNNLHRQ